MSYWKFIVRSLIYHRRGHISLFLGVCTTCAIVTGALLIGDSVKYSLKQVAEQRLGKIQLAMETNDRYIREGIAQTLAENLNAHVSAAIRLEGVISNPDQSQQANKVQILGVDTGFWELGNSPVAFRNGDSDQIVINRKLAERIRARLGDTILARIEKPTILPGDAALISVSENAVAIRLLVTKILDAEEFGNFNLNASQIAPYNAFIPLRTLQDLVNRPGRANLILAGSHHEQQFSPQEADGIFRKAWSLVDIGLKIRELPNKNMLEVQSDRIFLDRSVARAISTILPNSQKILTYFVNELRVGDRSTPYSMVAAVEKIDSSNSKQLIRGPFPDVDDDEILISTWCAQDLKASQGDRLTLNYNVIDQRQHLAGRESTFIVRDIIPMPGAGIDQTISPEIPGLSDARNCREWNTGIPIDLSKIRKKDEDYWDRYQNTPKAVISLAAGQKIWDNRFGNLTAIRFPKQSETETILKNRLPQVLNPKSIGLHFSSVRETANDAVNHSIDFGILFMCFSFFLIMASVLLTGLFFVFHIDQRFDEQGTLLALGFSPKRIRLIYLIEGLFIALPGSGLGVLAGIAYTLAVLRALSTLWQDAVGNWPIVFQAQFSSIVVGFLTGIVVTLATQYLCLRRLGTTTLLSRLIHLPERYLKHDQGRYNGVLYLGIICLAAAVFALFKTARSHDPNAAIGFFGAGVLALISGLAFCSYYLQTLSRENSKEIAGLFRLGIRNLARRQVRSLSVIAIIACASFIIIALESQRLGSLTNTSERTSGTGGFALFAELTRPIYHDLNSSVGREELGLDPLAFSDVQFVPMRILDGDDASCLNLNQAQKPRIIGVDPNTFATRRAFSFLNSEKHSDIPIPWQLLKHDFGDKVIPAIADFSTIKYALGKKIGDHIPYIDEHGDTLQIRLVGAMANSVLQGTLIVDEASLTKHFPSVAGFRMFLIDANKDSIEYLREVLNRSFQDFGLELSTTTELLDEFNKVQNTYISIFQALGGLGMLLGSIGLGVLLLRNVMERRSELSVMNAIGFSKKSIRMMLLDEYGLLLILGLICGVCSSILVVYPRLETMGSRIPLYSLTGLLGFMLVTGFVWTWLAAAFAMRCSLITGLRNE